MKTEDEPCDRAQDLANDLDGGEYVIRRLYKLMCREPRWTPEMNDLADRMMNEFAWEG